MRLTPLAALPALALFLVPGPTAAARAADPSAESPEPLEAWLALAPLPAVATASDAAGETLFVLDTAERGRPQELWSLPRSGGAALRLSGPLAPGERVGEFALSPDGRAVAFTVAADGGPRRLFWTPAAGGTPRLVSERPRGRPTATRASPSGRTRWRSASSAEAIGPRSSSSSKRSSRTASKAATPRAGATPRPTPVRRRPADRRCTRQLDPRRTRPGRPTPVRTS